VKLKDIRWGAALGGALVAMVVLVASAFAWVAIYSLLLHRGESQAFYEQYAVRASPWVSLVMGIPRVFSGLSMDRPSFTLEAWPAAMGVFGIYLLMDLPLTLLGGDNPAVTPLYLAANILRKFLGCHFGGRSAARMEVASAA
jgi:hypothetical protein